MNFKTPTIASENTASQLLELLIKCAITHYVIWDHWCLFRWTNKYIFTPTHCKTSSITRIIHTKVIENTYQIHVYTMDFDPQSHWCHHSKNDRLKIFKNHWIRLKFGTFITFVPLQSAFVCTLLSIHTCVILHHK